MSFVPRLRTLLTLSILAAPCLTATADVSGASQGDSLVWRSDLLSPAVLDATRKPEFWRVDDAVAEWRNLHANINPAMASHGLRQITVVERPSERWLAKGQVFVREGYVTRARLLLNSHLRHAPFTEAFAQHLLCRELGHVLGLRGSACARTNGDALTSPTPRDEVRLARLYAAVASSVSKDPSLTPEAGRWVTVHVVRR